MRGAVLAALGLAACWTGVDPPVVVPVSVIKSAVEEPAKLRVTLERTACFSLCPTYTVVIHGDGRVDWVGQTNVLAIGHRHGRVSRIELDELSRRLERAQFFERDEYGEPPVSICSDTSHAVITVKRGTQTQSIDNDHCTEQPELDALEEYIDRIANTGPWIGP